MDVPEDMHALENELRALRQEQERARESWEQSVNGLFRTHPDGRLLDANRALAVLFGYDSAAELLAAVTHVDQFYVEPERRGEMLVALQSAGQVQGAETRIYRRDGGIIWVAVNARTVRAADGTLLYFEGSLQEVTERKQTEEALRMSEARYRAVVETQMEMICRHRPDGTLTFVNEAYCRSLGRTREELLGQSFMPWVPDPDRSHLIAHLASLTPDRPTASIEHRLRTQSGDLRWRQWDERAFFDADGRLLEIQAVGRDVTAQHEAAEALRDSEARFRLLADRAQDMIFRVDFEPQRHFSYVSPASVQVTGYPPEAFYDDFSLVFRIVHPEDRPRFQRFMATEKLFTEPQGVRWVRPDGTIVWGDLRPTPIFDGFGQIVAVEGIARDVTAQHEAAEALRAGDARYRAVVETQTEMICRYQPDGTLTFVNEAYCRMLGRPREELLGQSFVPFVASEDRAWVGEFRASVTAENPLVTIECRTWVASGELRWQQWNRRGLFDADGRLMEIQSVGRDVTDRRRAEEALRESEARFRLLAENAQDMIFRLSYVPVPHFEYISPAVTGLIGYTPEECYADLQVAWGAIHPEDRARVQSAIRAPRENREPVELRCVHRDGRIVWFEQRSTPIRDEAGCLIAVEAIVRDITERKRAEAALRESEARFRLLAENAQDAIYRMSFTPQVHFEYISPAAKGLTGYTPEELYADAMLSARNIHPDDQVRFAAFMRAPAENSGPIELRWLQPDGSVRWGEQCTTPIFDAAGRLVALEGITRDITTRRLAEEELRRHRAHLEDLVRERTSDLTRTNERLRAEIAERRRAEDALVRSEQQYRRIVETSQEGIWVVDANLRTTFVNGRLTSMLGYDEAELLGRPLSDFVPEMRNVRGPDILGQLDRYPSGRRDQRLRRKDGSSFWALISAGPILDDDGRIIGVLGMVTDIDNRVRVERERDEQRRTMRVLLDTLPDLVIFKDRDSTFRVCNAATARVLGSGGGHEELIGKNDFDLFPPELAEVFRCEELQVIETGEMVTGEHCFDVAGEQRWFDSLKVPLRDESGEVIGVLVADHDVTQRKLAEERVAAAASLAETRATVAHLLQGQQPLAERLTAALAEVAGPEDEIAVFTLASDGATLEKLAARGQSWSTSTTACRTLLAGGHGPFTEEGCYVVPLIHGALTLGVLCVPAASPGMTPARTELLGQVAELVGLAIANDRLAVEAQRARLEAEEASRAKSSFLASMSHELRTPLNTILGLSEALQDGAYELLNERQAGALHTMEVSGRHLLGIISDILDFSKAEAGQLELDIGPAAVADVCQTSLRLTRGLALEKRLEIGLEIDDPGMILAADARRLVQILVNLLTNAVKFTPEGGRIGLAVTCDAANATVRFTVWDSGLGIAAHNLPRLFRPFVQLDDALSRQYAGAGLGLSLVHRMTEMHGGHVEVESEPGCGSRFIVVLPWRPAGGTE